MRARRGRAAGLDRPRINQRGYVAVDTETTGLNEMQAELVGISLSVEPGAACYIPLGPTKRVAGG